MSEPFVAEIRIVAFNFAPRGWAFCNGQLLPVAQNTALFSLIGTTYGGDGRSTMALPDLQGRASVHPGRGPGLTAYRLGERAGSVDVTLTEAQMPQHDHALMAFQNPGTLNAPNNQRVLARARGGSPYKASPTNPTDLAEAAVGATGGGQSHNNMQPYLGMNFCIALQGLYPSRS